MPHSSIVNGGQKGSVARKRRLQREKLQAAHAEAKRRNITVTAWQTQKNQQDAANANRIIQAQADAAAERRRQWEARGYGSYYR